MDQSGTNAVSRAATVPFSALVDPYGHAHALMAFHSLQARAVQPMPFGTNDAGVSENPAFVFPSVLAASDRSAAARGFAAFVRQGGAPNREVVHATPSQRAWRVPDRLLRATADEATG